MPCVGMIERMLLLPTVQVHKAMTIAVKRTVARKDNSPGHLSIGVVLSPGQVAGHLPLDPAASMRTAG